MVTRRLKYFALLLTVLLFAGCSSMSAYLKEYGSFEPSKEITRAYESYELTPDMTYYWSGSSAYPNAIMGLKRNYTLETSLWAKTDMTPEKLKEFVTGMQKRAQELNLYLLGWSMRDEKGNEIGTWYSVLFATTSIKVKGEKVSVYRPPDNTYEKYDRGDRRDPKN